MAIYFLIIDDVLDFHNQLIERFGGSTGIRDKNLLESALAQPQMAVFGRRSHQDVYAMAAAYCYHIIKNHPFIDGNKRTGLLCAMVFLTKNGFNISVDFDDLYEFTHSVATSKISKDEIAIFFKLHSTQNEELPRN